MTGDHSAYSVGQNQPCGAAFGIVRCRQPVQLLGTMADVQLAENLPDNLLFGKWDCLIAVQPSKKRIQKLPGHGGEILPGRLIDHIDALRVRAVNGVTRPVQLDIDPTMACPSSCTFCFSKPYRKTRNRDLCLNDELLFSVIEYWIGQGVKVVRFDGGGDPLAHPRCIDAIEFAASRGAGTALLTAADLLRYGHLPRLVKAGTYVRISLNAATDVTRLSLHSSYRRSYGVERIFALMNGVSGMRARFYGAAGKSEMPLGATFMVHPANLHEVAEAARRARDAGFDHISFRVILGAKQAVLFSAEDVVAARAAFSEAKNLETDEFRVFVPARSLTDTGYLPSAYFASCVCCTHRVLVEVGSRAGEAAQVPCGRYRGSGFTSGVTGNLNVLQKFRVGEMTRPWPSSVVMKKTLRYPSGCSDCIDRSANLMFNGILERLKEDMETRFFRAKEVN